MNKFPAAAVLALLPLALGCSSFESTPPRAPTFTLLGVAQTPAGDPLAGVLADRAVALSDDGLPFTSAQCTQDQLAFPDFEPASIEASAANGSFSAEYVADIVGPVCVKVRLRAPAGSGLRDTTLTPLVVNLRLNILERRDIGEVRFTAAP